MNSEPVITLGQYIGMFDELIKLYVKGEVRAFRKGKLDNSLFDLSRRFLLSMQAPDGSICYPNADISLLAECNKYDLVHSSVSDEEYQQHYEQQRGHLRVVGG